MATTIPTLSPTELRERLSELRELAEGVFVAEKEMRARAADLRLHDWEISRYTNAVSGELRGVYELLLDNAPEDGLEVNELVDRIVDTLDVIDLAIRSAEELGDA